MTSTMPLRCPKCAGEMATYERSGITLDQCRECRGFFLDRGELEKLIDAEGGAWMGPTPGVPAQATHAAPIPVPVSAAGYPGMPQGYPAMPQGYPGSPQGRSVQPQPARYDDRDRGGSRSEWHDDDDDHDDRRGFDPRRSSGRPSKKRSLFSDLLEGLGE
ncbi:MAG TPA: zf-TFIIB domain-containing protein [Candidatus Limnocylindrales bacterium]|nr:zf-TFIIB domain-containing protein [Candidatus Limnocylindrales bacterium]